MKVKEYNLNLFIVTFLFMVLIAPNCYAGMNDKSHVKLQSLDKVTARTMTFEAQVGSTVKFGPLFIKIQSCRKSDPIDNPESAAFLQIWEVTPEEKAQWVFSGWMFASSPALSSMDHPIYDVWVLDCLQIENAAAEDIDEDTDKEASVDSIQNEEPTEQ
jgi:hypothetical protein